MPPLGYRNALCRNREHPMMPDNVYVNRQGQRRCRACMRAKARRRYALERAKRPPKAPKPLTTHCRRGHELTPENMILREGRRACRECHRARARAYVQRKARGRARDAAAR